MDATAAATLFAWLDREIWLLTARSGDRSGGLIATFVTQASIVPDLPRVLVGLAKQHHTTGLVEQSRCFALHLLSRENLELVWRFALRSGPDDKFAEVPVRPGRTGSPILDHTVGWLECRVEASLDTGDRTIYVAEVVDGAVTHFAEPLTSQALMEQAPSHLLTQLQRHRHQDSYREAEAIRCWREARDAAP